MSCDSDNQSQTDVINLGSRFKQLDRSSNFGFLLYSVCVYGQDEIETLIKRSVGPLVSDTLWYQRQCLPGVETSTLGTLDDTMHIFCPVGTYFSRRK
jgi:hypothetical protein